MVAGLVLCRVDQVHADIAEAVMSRLLLWVCSRLADACAAAMRPGLQIPDFVIGASTAVYRAAEATVAGPRGTLR